MFISEVVKITKSGQITVPKAIRNILKSDTLVFEVMDNHEVHLVPVQSTSGVLKEYANKQDSQEARESIWRQEVSRHINKATKE